MADQDVKERRATTEPTRENPFGPIGTEVVFENDQVRVWDIQVAPGGKKAWHHNELDYVIINITGGKIELENVEGRTVVIDDKAGGVIWRDTGERHELGNLSGKPYQNVLVELKHGKRSMQS
jgi:quercetin dioxygenase-like cupin family protein